MPVSREPIAGLRIENDTDFDDLHFPVNLPLIQNLIGKMLTHVEAMGLSATAEKANKDLVRQSVWAWFSDVQENSLTSYRGCIAPIECLRDETNHTERKYVWHGGGPEADHAVSVNI